jgi:integrase
MAKITKREIDALRSEGGKPTFLWDGALSGFGVRALGSGKKSFIVKYRTNGGGRSAPQRWLTLGTYGQLTLDQARQLAQKALAAVADGKDPQRLKFDQRVAPDLSDVWKRFETDILPMRKPTTGKEYRSQWTNLIESKIGKRKVESITSEEIDRFHKSMRATPYRANRVLALLKHLMALAERWGMRTPGTNPCSRVEQFKERARERYLTPSELKSIGEAIDALIAEKSISITAGHAIELLALSGARLSEVLNSRWEWIDFEREVMLLPDSKTGAKPIYLSAAAVEVLERQKQVVGGSRFVFPSPKLDKPLVNLRKAWVQVCERAELDGVRLHDLRHTVASIAVGQGASLPLIGKLLGHSQAQTTMRYAHVDIDPALKAANEVASTIQHALRPNGRK